MYWPMETSLIKLGGDARESNLDKDLPEFLVWRLMIASADHTQLILIYNFILLFHFYLYLNRIIYWISRPTTSN